MPRHVVLDPRCRLELRVLVVAEVNLLAAPGIAHHFPAIAGQIRAMNDQRANRPFARRLLEFVGPAPVISEGLPIEEFRILRGRLVHDHQHHLALDVHALVIVPGIFRRLDAVADKHDRRVDIDAVGLRLVADHEVIGELQGERVALRRLQRRRGGRLGLHADEIDSLQIAAVIAGGLQAVQRKLRRNVVGRNVAAACSGAAPLEQIIGQESHVRSDSPCVDALHCRIDGGWQPQLRRRPCRGCDGAGRS